MGIFSADEKRVFEHTDRVHPIYFEFPSQKEDDVTISLPLGWEIGSLPPVQDLDARAAVYTLRAENDKGSLHLSRKLGLNIMLLDQKYYAALRNFFQAVRTGDEEQIVLQPIGATASK